MYKRQALGVSIADALKAPQLVLFSAATVGIAGNELGGPVGALVATVVAAELGKIVSKETRVDIIVTPGVTIISGVLIAQFVGPGVAAFMTAFGNLVKTATEMQPFFMGILVSGLIGIALTLPISSACLLYTSPHSPDVKPPFRLIQKEPDKHRQQKRNDNRYVHI